MPSPQLPASIGRYQIRSLLGRGGMGEVYEAFDPGLERTVALKTIRGDADDPLFLERLYREARACGRLRHPRIITVHDLGEAGGIVFIAMEHLEGETLGSAMRRGQLSFVLKLQLLIQILDALHYAHGEGVVHRDIKPGNVFLLPDDTIKILDFGLARSARSESLTQTGAVMGTPHYMSPEQMKGQPVDGRTDVYSTGVVAYEMFTQRRAFDGEAITTVMLKVLSEAPPPMDTALIRSFPEVERIVLQAMAKSVEDRFATAGEMRDAFSAFLASSQAAITRAQSTVTLASQEAVSEARTLINSGQVSQSQALLEQTLRSDPDSIDARTLLRQLARTPASPPGTHEATLKAQLSVSAAAPNASTSHREEKPTRPTIADLPRVSATKSAPSEPATRRSMVWIVVPAAVIVAVGIVAFALRGRPESGAVPPARTAAPAASVPVPSTVETQAPTGSPALAGPPQSSGATAPSSASETPTASAPGAARPQSNGGADAPAARSGGSPSGVTRSGQAKADGRSVYLEPRMEPALRNELMSALRTRTVAMAPTPGDARRRVTARVDVSVRPAPFDTASVTADYVTTLEVSDAVTRTTDTRRLDGRVLDFGEAPARVKAVRAAAEQIADVIEGMVRE